MFRRLPLLRACASVLLCLFCVAGSKANEVPRAAESGAVAAQSASDELIREALRNRGTRYVWGGASRGGFDCSGFVLYVYKKMLGIALPHSAAAQSRMGVPVAKEALQPGDLIFFSTYRASVSHVGIYLGDNRFIHAANRRTNVRVDALSGYYASRYRGARRLSPTPVRIPVSELTVAPTGPGVGHARTSPVGGPDPVPLVQREPSVRRPRAGASAGFASNS